MSARSHLKSNMDRFIVHENFSHADSEVDLKSNMDRFIVKTCRVGGCVECI